MKGYPIMNITANIAIEFMPYVTRLDKYTPDTFKAVVTGAPIRTFTAAILLATNNGMLSIIRLETEHDSAYVQFTATE
jgi:hypothetical protein